MTRPVTLSEQFLRRKPLPRAGETKTGTLKRGLSTFQVASFGIGSTIGTGIFVVMQQAVPHAGPAVIISFIAAGIAAGLAAICYAELASAVPISGSTYSYAYSTMGEFMAMVVGACLLLEYGVSIAAVAVGWSEYLSEFLGYIGLPRIPQALSAAPWDSTPGLVNLPAMILIGLCAILLIRGASESARINAIMVCIKVGVLTLFIVIGLSAFHANNLVPFMPHGVHGISTGASIIFFSFIGLDAVCTASEEVENPQKTMPRALLIALLTVITVYILVALAAVGAQAAGNFDDTDQTLATILNHITGQNWPSIIFAAGAIVSIFSVTLVTMYGQTRIFFAMGRDGMLPRYFTRVNAHTLTPVNSTIIVMIVTMLMAGWIPLHYLADTVSIGTLIAFMVVAVGVIILRIREPHLPRGFTVPGYPVTPILAVLACMYVLWGLHWYTWLFFGLWVSVALGFYLLWGRHHSALQHPPQHSEALENGHTA